MKTRGAPKKAVVGYVNTPNNRFLVHFNSLKEAAAFVGLRNSGDISNACGGISHSAGKWHGEPIRWEYV